MLRPRSVADLHAEIFTVLSSLHIECRIWPMPVEIVDNPIPLDGDSRLEQPAFYSYAAPEPEGFRESAVSPAATYYHPNLNGFYLHYDDVRNASDPEAALLELCQTTYDAAADKGKWDRAALER